MQTPDKKYSVLVISDLYPNPSSPAFGIFVERQCAAMQPYVDQVVICPVRVFPSIALWKEIFKTRSIIRPVKKWLGELNKIPLQKTDSDIPVYYPRYTSLPKQIFLSLWGYFAYPAVLPIVKRLTATYHFDLIHTHYAVPGGTIGLLLKRWLHIPVVISVHGFDIAYAVNQKPIGRYIVPRALQAADAVLANSTNTVNKIMKYHDDPSRVHLVNLGADPEVAIEPENNIVHDKFQILTVGSLETQKGQGYVLSALGELKKMGYQFQYTLVGPGSQLGNYKNQARELGIEAEVQFIGFKKHEEVWQYYQQCDVFILASWNEAFGLVYIEALQFGKPVIGCRGEGGPEDLARLGDCIELVQSKDAASIRDALKKFLDDPDYGKRKGEIGRNIVQAHYTWAHTAQETLKIYDQLINR